MGGIYLHIPFCRQACSYCDFHFSTNLEKVHKMVLAINNEAMMRNDFFSEDERVETVYFGGGTPSLLSQQDMRFLLQGLKSKYHIVEDAEVTLEANPDDLSRQKQEQFYNVGINRLSIGIQSFFDEDLELMRRAHNANEAHDCLGNAREVGFENISIDLIYGVPGAEMDRWKENVQLALEHRPQHISAYALTVEPKTLLHHQVHQNKVVLPEDESYQEQFFYLIDALEGAGYEHYELSNFALPGFRSRHNSSYWNGVPYLGLGPSAHSYRDNVRSWNVRNNALYLKAIEAGGEGLFEDEQLSPRDQLNEYLMTHLRKAEGLDLNLMQEKWQFHLREREPEAWEQFASQGWIIPENGHLRLSREGKMMSDAIIREFFQVDEDN
jgi:oxygen-independent coproporphyrinogen-3 oxidase